MVLGVSMAIGGTTKTLDGFFRGKSHENEDDDWGTPMTMETSISWVDPQDRSPIFDDMNIQLDPIWVDFWINGDVKPCHRLPATTGNGLCTTYKIVMPGGWFMALFYPHQI